MRLVTAMAEMFMPLKATGQSGRRERAYAEAESLIGIPNVLINNAAQAPTSAHYSA